MYLSEKGRLLANQIYLNFEKIDAKALIDCNETEKEMLIELLLRINKNMCNKGDVKSEQERNG